MLTSSSGEIRRIPKAQSRNVKLIDTGDDLNKVYRCQFGGVHITSKGVQGMWKRFH